jgi:hypothetical protein
MSTDYSQLPVLDAETLREPLHADELHDQLPDNDKDLKDALVGWLDDFWEQERGPAQTRRKTAHKCRLFYIDEQLTWDSPDTQWPEALAVPPGELYWINNQYAPMIDSLVKEAARSRAQYDFIAPDESVDDTMAAKLATAIANHYQPRLLTAQFLQDEFKRALFDGGFWRQLRVVDGLGPMSPRYETQQKPIQLAPGGYECPECGYFVEDDVAADPLGFATPEDTTPPEAPELPEPASADPDNAPAAAADALGEPMVCPRCGTPMVHQEPVTDQLDEQVEIGKERGPDFVLEGVDSEEMCTNSWAPSLDYAIWLRRLREVDWSIARQLHPNARLFTGDPAEDMENDQTIQRQRQIRESYGGANRELTGLRLSDLGRNRMVAYCEDWLSPVVYEHYETRQREVFPDGMVLESGTRLIEAFPDGIKVCRVNGEIAGIYNEDFHQWWLYCPYKSVPGRFWGKGVEGALPLQEWLNELVSLIMTYLMEASSPTRVVDGRVFPAGVNVGGIPSMVWRTENKPDNVDINNVFRVFPPGQLSEGVYAMFQRIIEQMQSQIGAWSAFGAGMPDAAGKTATGMSLMQEAATNLMATALGLRAECDAQLMRLLLFHFRNEIQDERVFKIGGQHSRDKVAKLTGADLDFDIEVQVKEGSYFPRQEFQRRNDVVEYWNTYNVIAGAKAQLQASGQPERFEIEERRLLANRFGVPEVVNRAELATEKAHKQIDMLTQFVAELDQPDPQRDQEMFMLVQQAAMMNPMMPPEQIAQMIVSQWVLDKLPVQKYSDLHRDMAEAMIVWCNSDDAEDASPQLMQIVDARIGELFKAANDMDALRSGMPTPEEQMMMMQAQAEAEAAQAFAANEGGQPAGKASGTPSTRQGPGPQGGKPYLPTGKPGTPSMPGQGR